MAKRMMVLGSILSTALALAACASRTERPTPEGLRAATPPEVRHVFLEYYPDRSETACVGVYDDPVTIWMSTPPSRVEWQVRDKEDDFQWVIEYDPEKEPAYEGESPFPAGRIVIPCRGDAAYRTVRPTGPGRWPYRVSVFRCTDGRPDPKPVCVKDPGVIIWE